MTNKNQKQYMYKKGREREKRMKMTEFNMYKYEVSYGTIYIILRHKEHSRNNDVVID